MEEAIKILIKCLQAEETVLDNIETVKAPSGEWDEYNIEYLNQQSKVTALEESICILNSNLEGDM